MKPVRARTTGKREERLERKRARVTFDSFMARARKLERMKYLDHVFASVCSLTQTTGRLVRRPLWARSAHAEMPRAGLMRAIRRLLCVSSKLLGRSGQGSRGAARLVESNRARGGVDMKKREHGRRLTRERFSAAARFSCLCRISLHAHELRLRTLRIASVELASREARDASSHIVSQRRLRLVST